jgi:hypothetical protein
MSYIVEIFMERLLQANLWLQQNTTNYREELHGNNLIHDISITRYKFI